MRPSAGPQGYPGSTGLAAGPARWELPPTPKPTPEQRFDGLAWIAALTWLAGTAGVAVMGIAGAIGAGGSGGVGWYVGRACGLMALVLFTASTVLGVLVRRKKWLPGLPRFASAGLHRNASLLGLLFVLMHVCSMVLGQHVPVDAHAVLLPFSSGFQRLFLGLGSTAFLLLLAVTVTSVLRTKIAPRAWRGVHLAAYAMWPLALSHAMGMSGAGGEGFGVARIVGFLCLAVFAGAVAYRLRAGVRTRASREAAWR